MSLRDRVSVRVDPALRGAALLGSSPLGFSGQF